MRNIVLSANGELTEHIKWNAPSFCYRGEDRFTFNLQGKGFFRLVFHCGAKAKDSTGQSRLFEDATGLLEWVADDRALAKFTDMSDVLAKKEALTATVQAWLKATTAQPQ